MKRGELWTADLGPDVGPHPVVLLSRQASYGLRGRATVASITTNVRPIRTHVAVGPEEGLTRDSAVNCDDLLTISVGQLKQRIGEASPAKLRDVERGVLVGLGINCASHVEPI